MLLLTIFLCCLLCILTYILESSTQNYVCLLTRFWKLGCVHKKGFLIDFEILPTEVLPRSVDAMAQSAGAVEYTDCIAAQG